MLIHENRKKMVGEMYDYVGRLVDISIQTHRKIIIWGFGRGGKLLRHIIRDIDGRVKENYIIDDKLRVSYDSEPAIYRSSLLEYIDTSEFIVCSCIRGEGVRGRLWDYGYRLGDNLFDVHADIGNSYIDFLEKKNKKLNFDEVYKDQMEKDFGREYNEHIPFGYACVDNVFNEIIKLDNDLSFFDYGCGKGAAILLAFMSGINKIGGVEIIKSIYDQAVTNMDELKIVCNLLNQDATECNIDDYNCFFFYNPFGGSVLKKVISNIQNSYINNKRRIYLVYANPFAHRIIIEDGFFRLYKQIRTDLWDPLCNIYLIDNKRIGEYE